MATTPDRCVTLTTALCSIYINIISIITSDKRRVERERWRRGGKRGGEMGRERGEGEGERERGERGGRERREESGN